VELGGKWPVSIVATPDVAAGARLWRTAGSHRLTIVVKSTFSPLHQQPMQLAAPDGLIVDDAHLDGDESRSVIASSDLAPYLPRAEVLFVGCAHSATPVPGLSVRIGLYGARPLIEKTLHVVGTRTLAEHGAGPPEPFVELPIVYEQALRGAMDENPVGIVPAPGVQMPTVLDPDDAGSPAGFGPLSPRWPGRRRLLRQLDPGLLEAAVPELPDAFAWSYFQAAPPDQRCPFFIGDEWIVLDNLWPGAARLESRLPSARAGARVYDGARFMDVPLIADTLFIDGTRQVCSVVWRGNVPIDPARLSEINVMAGLELPGRPIPWPEPASPSIPEIASAPSAPPQEAWQGSPQQEATPQPQHAPSAVPPSPEAAAARQSGLHQAVGQPGAGHQAHPSGLHQAVPGQQPAPQQGYAQNPSGQHQAVAAPPQGYAQNPSGQHQAVAAPPHGYTPHPSGQYQAATPQQGYAQNPSGQHQAVAAPQQGYTPHPSGQYQAATPQPGSQPPYAADPQQPQQPQQPYPQHPSGQYQAAAPSPQGYAQNPQNAAYPQGGAYGPPDAQPSRAPTPPPGSTPGLRMRNPTPAPHVRQPTPTMGQAVGSPMMRTPTPPPGSPRAGFESRPQSDPQGLPPPPPAMPAPPPPPPPDELAGEDDEGHTVMRPVDAKLLEQLASMDGPTSVGRNQQHQREIAAAVAAVAAPPPPPPPPGAKEERAESTALFTISADTTLMRLARGEMQSPVSQALSQAETARRPTQEHSLNLDEQTVVGDQHEIDRLLNDAATTSSRGQSPAAGVAVAGLRPVPPPEQRPAQPTHELFSAEDLWGDEGPSTQNDPHVQSHSAPPPTMAVPTAPESPSPEQNRRALRATSRGLGPVHVMEAEVMPPATPTPPPAAPTSPPPRQVMDATRSGGQSLQQALRDEMLGRLASGQSFADANLEGQDLSGLDLSGKIFTNANLRGVKLERAKLDGADLGGAKLDGAQLTGASLTGARLVGASLEEAVLDGAMLLSAALDEANLSKASLAGCVLVDATATRANFREAELRDARLDRSRLASADFERAKMTNASFLACDLTEASFFEAAGVSASFVEANLGGARFEQSHFALARFSRATAPDTLWNEAVLDGASFEAASLTGATFAKASCLGTIFSSSDLTDARFQRAKLDGASFTGADIEGAVFDTPGGPPTAPPSSSGFSPTSL
jgi:uncharacterized protein YjbI with pentapeptide repeats